MVSSTYIVTVLSNLHDTNMTPSSYMLVVQLYSLSNQECTTPPFYGMPLVYARVETLCQRKRSTGSFIHMQQGKASETRGIRSRIGVVCVTERAWEESIDLFQEEEDPKSRTIVVVVTSTSWDENKRRRAGILFFFPHTPLLNNQLHRYAREWKNNHESYGSWIVPHSSCLDIHFQVVVETVEWWAATVVWLRWKVGRGERCRYKW